MKKYFLIPALILLAASAAFFGLNRVPNKSLSAAASEFNNPCQNGLCVTASAVVKVQPDFASLSFNVETKSKVLSEAQSENAEQMANIIAQLKALNISEEDIKTTGFYIFPEHDYTYGSRFTGYRVTNQLNVKLRDLSSAGSMIDAVTSAGANVFNGIQFAIEDSSKAYNEALAKAVALAKDKALILSEAADIDNIKIVSVEEIQNTCYGYDSVCYAKSAGGAAFTPIMHGELEISASVRIVYEIVA